MTKHDAVVLRELLLAWSTLPDLTRSKLRALLGLELAGEHIADLHSTSLAETLSIDHTCADAVRSLGDPDRAHARAATFAHDTLTIVDDGYPEQLRASADPPLVLHFKGDEQLLETTAIAIVGSRKATSYGINAARLLATQLAQRGIVVVSGLAWGIDAAAHRSALDHGTTIAVLGTGIDVAYPRSNRALHEEIGEHGLLLSEFPAGTKPRPHNFPVRNRIIASLALGVVVIEAADRSGSLITARLANEEGRDVFAVPGSIFSQNSAGTTRLIQDGAKLVRDVDDILEELPGIERVEGETLAAKERPVDPACQRVLEALSLDEPLHPDFLGDRADTPGQLYEILLQLELEGWIRRVSGGAYVRNAV